MNELTIAGIAERDFRVDASYDGTVVTASLSGTADLRFKHTLARFLGDLHREVSRLGAPEVRVDCRGLEFMNSSCFKDLVSWVGNLQDAEIDQRYKIRFVSNSSLHWQRRSLRALSCFASELVSVES